MPQQAKPQIGQSGKVIPAGYYEGLDDDGEYHLYPILEEGKVAQIHLNNQMGVAIVTLGQAWGCIMNTFTVQQAEALQVPKKPLEGTENWRHAEIKYISEENQKEELGELKEVQPVAFTAQIVVEPVFPGKPTWPPSRLKNPCLHTRIHVILE